MDLIVCWSALFTVVLCGESELILVAGSGHVVSGLITLGSRALFFAGI